MLGLKEVVSGSRRVPARTGDFEAHWNAERAAGTLRPERERRRSLRGRPRPRRRDEWRIGNIETVN